MWKLPGRTSTNLWPPATATGVTTIEPEELPSPMATPNPQQYARPFWSRPQLWVLPVAIRVRLKVATATAASGEGVRGPAGSSQARTRMADAGRSMNRRRSESMTHLGG